MGTKIKDPAVPRSGKREGIPVRRGGRSSLELSGREEAKAKTKIGQGRRKVEDKGEKKKAE